jgi:hypothetical protein
VKAAAFAIRADRHPRHWQELAKIGLEFRGKEPQFTAQQEPFVDDVLPLHPVRSTAKKLNPATTLGEHEEVTPHVPESPQRWVQIGGGIGIRKRG